MSYRQRLISGLIAEGRAQARKPVAEPGPAPSAANVEAAAVRHFRRCLGYPDLNPDEEAQ